MSHVKKQPRANFEQTLLFLSLSLSANSNFVLSLVTHNIVKRIKSIKVTPIKYDEHALDAKVSSSKTALTTSTHKFNFLLK